jgi:hypothetical protein
VVVQTQQQHFRAALAVFPAVVRVVVAHQLRTAQQVQVEQEGRVS